MVNISEINYLGWPKSVKLSNNVLELVITTAVGPRIIHFSHLEGENLFMVDPQTAGIQGGDTFRLYGGHRLWRAPEDREQTYFPDNKPITFSPTVNGGRFVAPIEPTTHLQKEIEIALEDENSVVITHRITNYAPYPQELAAWALSVMRPDGVAVLPLPDLLSHDEHLLPTQTFILWGYTNLADPRWRFHTGCLYLWQDEKATSPQKIGFSNGRGWIAYCHSFGTFVKQYLIEDKIYPDLGAVTEVFTDHRMLELETLSPLVSLESGDTVQHLERWLLLEPIADELLDTPQEVIRWIESQL
ncbi:MAG: hypothetical protein CUN55_09815 [Phototrophicales bacterium]|nr:MAG: hypothetical protein CUN55_09815 [Phototrophicales bacterium]